MKDCRSKKCVQVHNKRAEGSHRMNKVNNGMKTMYIMSGCQGSGKSTWARIKISAITVSADNYFVDKNGVYRFSLQDLGKAHAECFHKAILTVLANQDCIVDNTNSTALEIAPYYALAKAYGYNVVLVKVNCDPDKASKRNTHGVTEAVVKATAKRCANLNIPSYWDIEVRKVYHEG